MIWLIYGRSQRKCISSRKNFVKTQKNHLKINKNFVKTETQKQIYSALKSVKKVQFREAAALFASKAKINVFWNFVPTFFIALLSILGLPMCISIFKYLIFMNDNVRMHIWLWKLWHISGARFARALSGEHDVQICVQPCWFQGEGNRVQVSESLQWSGCNFAHCT